MHPDAQPTPTQAHGPHPADASLRVPGGERTLGERLDAAVPEPAVVFHDLRVPGQHGRIDHVVVAPSGMWVIAAEYDTGVLVHHPSNGSGSESGVLAVGGRDRSDRLTEVAGQVRSVRGWLESGDAAAPVQGALCCVNADWGWCVSPFRVGDVLVAWPSELVDRIKQEHHVGVATVREVADLVKSSHRVRR